MIFNKNVIRIALTAIGVVGIPLTSWLSIKCHDKKKPDETKKEKLIRYAPAIVSGVVSSACMIGSHRMSSKEIMALTTTASFAVASKNELEKAIKPYISDEDAKKIKADTMKKVVTKHDGPSIENTGRGPLQCLEAYSGRLFYSSMEAVMEAECKISRKIMDGEYCCMNDFYRYLGIAQTEFGDCWGWVPNDDIYPKWYEDNPLGFENEIVEDENGESLMVISMMSYPIEGWRWE